MTSPFVDHSELDAEQENHHDEVDISSSEEEDVEQSANKHHDAPAISGPELKFKHDGFPWRNFEVKRPDDSTAYFADISVFKRGKPDITVHSGGKEGPVVGVARFSGIKSIKAGLGSDELSMDWVDITRPLKFGSKNFEFEFQGREYSLSRSRGQGMKGMIASQYEFTENASANVIGSYKTDLSICSKTGTLTLAQGTSEQLETLVVVAITSMLEKARRRQGANGAIASQAGAMGGAY